MIFKLLFVLALVYAASAKHAFSSQHIHKHDGHHTKVEFKDKHGHHHYDYYTHPKFDFEYKIKDEHTGDHKIQRETRHGDVVKGFYSLHQPDGSERHVHYHGDHHSGSSLLSAIATVAFARPQHGHGNEHGFSSQSIVMHQSQQSSPTHAHQPQHYYQAHQQEDHDSHYDHPKYAFEYQVSNPHTGEHESRDGDVVSGVYSLHKADGTVRIVEYQADKHSGFNSVVRHERHAKHIVPEKKHEYHH